MNFSAAAVASAPKIFRRHNGSGHEFGPGLRGLRRQGAADASAVA